MNRFAQIETIISRDKETFANDFIKKLFSPEKIKSNSGGPAFIKEVILQNKEKNICATLLALASRTDTTASLAKIKMPVLIIRGEDDQIISKEQTDILHKGIQDSELKTVPNAGHLPNLEDPDRFNELLKNFLIENFLP